MTKVINAQLWTMVKATVAGLLIAETWRLTRALSRPLAEYVSQTHHDTVFMLLAVIGFLLTLSLMFNRGAHRTIGLILQSGRIDVYISFVAGLILATAFSENVEPIYRKAADALAPLQVIALTLLPLAWIAAILILQLLRRLAPPITQSDAFFVSDTEVSVAENDLLDVATEAQRFAEAVVNLRSSQNMSFGIDAPWGIGKSSFVNFCVEYWHENYADAVVVYDFNPLKFEGRANLLELFVDGLVSVIQEHEFQPEARRLIVQYSKYIKGAKASLHGLDLEFLPGNYSIDDSLKDLTTVLGSFKKQIVIVIDDLDRLAFSAVKDVLFAIKKSFALPRLTFVFCYDTENIGAVEEHKPDTDKVSEFFEKFINVKVSLYLNASKLSTFTSDNLHLVLSGNSQADPTLIAQAMGGLRDIYRQPDYYEYRPFIGDIRKIKRLINTLVLLQIEETDFETTDFNKDDLIHLLLIYVNCPNVFRDIYNSEAHDRGQLFSVVGPHDPGYDKSSDPQKKGNEPFQNSSKFWQYSKSLTVRQRFLINKVFNAVDRLGNQPAHAVGQDIKHSFACFNGGVGTGPNLRQYLQLIVKLAKPQSSSQYRFYAKCRDQIIAGTPLEEVLQQTAFLGPDSNGAHDQLWRMMVNSTRKFNYVTGANIIRYLLDNIPKYSLLEHNGQERGLRNKLPIYLVKLIDERGWADQSGESINNETENLHEIVEWIFGTGRHEEDGVIQTLLAGRGVLGLYDLLVFRLYCCADRSGDSYNLQRALSADSDPSAPTSGDTSRIAISEMRLLSQAIFAHFKRCFILARQNIFTLADELSWDDLAGEFDRAAADPEIIAASTMSIQSKIKVFITYQLASNLQSLGVPCGYYDESGNADKHNISDRMSSYLFDVCFGPGENGLGYQYFADYLLLSLSRMSSRLEFEQSDPDSRLRELTVVLDRGQLASYWLEHRAAIEAMDLTGRDRHLLIGGRTVTYRDDLQGAFSLLDEVFAATH